jgi:hypothetical protein
MEGTIRVVEATDDLLPAAAIADPVVVQAAQEVEVSRTTAEAADARDFMVGMSAAKFNVLVVRVVEKRDY